MRPYHYDLRIRIIRAVINRKLSCRQAARLYEVSHEFVRYLVRRYLESRIVDPLPHGGGSGSVLSPEQLELLRRKITENPDATLKELREYCGFSCGITTIWRAIHKLGYSVKKKSLNATEANKPEVVQRKKEYASTILGIPLRRLVFVDETGINTAMGRIYARAPIGERANGIAPRNWTKYSLLGALRMDGVAGALVIEGSADTVTFETFVEKILAPSLRPGDVVIWDNLNIHDSEKTKKCIENAGAKLLPMPPYSPKLNPIEEMWSKIKKIFRDAGARVAEEIYRIAGIALDKVTHSDIVGWFSHSFQEVQTIMHSS